MWGTTDQIITPDHQHSWLPINGSTTKSTFEPVAPSEFGETGLYRLVEFIYMFCKCGAARMSEAPKVKDSK